MDTCDYIWYTGCPLELPQQQQLYQLPSDPPGRSSSPAICFELRPVAVLQPPDGVQLPKGLPNKRLGSDHICLLTDFELVQRQVMGA